MKIYIGWDPRDELAFRACVSSLVKHSSVPLEIFPLKEYDLRRRGIFSRAYLVEASGQMVDGNDCKPFSTQFTFTRFAIPLIDTGEEWVLFCDADILFRDDVAKLFALADESKGLMCVQHNYTPPENVKFDGMLQQRYKRKNWSSVMLMKPSKCKISKAELNSASGRYLHQFQWMLNENIGAIPEEWNRLEGWDNPDRNPSVEAAAFHYTRGTPDMLPGTPYEEEWWQAVKAWNPSMNHHELSCV